MILSRAPTRITLGGGGTDLKSYYSKHGGFLIAGAIDKYCTILASKRFYDSIRLSYSQTEVRNNVADIKHRIFRAALELTGLEKGIELHSAADVPANCGLGTSSSFTVALLNALHTYARDFVSQKQLATQACHIEIDLLGEPIGKQDQYLAAFGGLTCLTFHQNGEVLVEPLRISHQALEQLEDNLLLFFTGKERSASEMLCDQDEKCKQDNPEMTANLHQIRDIGLETRKYLEKGQVDMLGELLHVHWETKKKRSRGMSDPFIDECYEVARKNGAVGGKLIGAGGGGFLMFYSANRDKPRLVETMQKMGLRWERFCFDFDGAKILVNA
ncbi:MAG: GHMP kinase [Dehalococcoidales bacterium]|jgi:D-glycero-alpha-D-manno-heptose-7-phosphate kinase|nr:GHMP kinase [Dehalococcoidales bacterium]|tara:strand:- start:204 stop:1190 length:987 start_codon:yes stop_codon:yes gene_type:complete